jgi:hypothetical protein
MKPHLEVGRVAIVIVLCEYAHQPNNAYDADDSEDDSKEI